MATEIPEFSPAFLAAAGLSVLAIFCYLAVVRGGTKRYPPAAGTVFHQVYHLRQLHDYHTDLFREHRTFRLLAPGRLQIYTSDPAVVEHILRTNFTNYGKGVFNYENMSDLLGDGIFAVDGDKWKQQRKIASYDFSTRALRDFSGSVFSKNAAKLGHIVSNKAAMKQSMDFQGLLMKATMDSIFTIAFGLDLNTLDGSTGEGSRFAAAFDDASEFTLIRYVNVFWKVARFLNVGAEATLRQRIKAVDEFVYKRIRARADEMSDDKAHDAEPKQDLLSRFILATTSDSGKVDYKYLRDIIMNIVIAGKDTTAGGLSWFLCMMCKHPEVQEKISKEVKDAANAGEAASVDEFSQSLTDEALNRMHYLHAALTETLRLYPSVPLDNKECFSDDVLPNGFSVGKGDIVFYTPYAMGRLERLWGDDTQVFRPERWLDEDGVFQPESPFKFTAFQAGPRICLGKEFAYRQMKIFAAVLLRFFVLALRDENASVSYRAMITLYIEQGLHLTATLR
ncbi:unnamed protein product [Alopecurus aequalis]